jgi:hypothetical protein
MTCRLIKSHHMSCNFFKKLKNIFFQKKRKKISQATPLAPPWPLALNFLFLFYFGFFFEKIYIFIFLKIKKLIT